MKCQSACFFESVHKVSIKFLSGNDSVHQGIWTTIDIAGHCLSINHAISTDNCLKYSPYLLE